MIRRETGEEGTVPRRVVRSGGSDEPGSAWVLFLGGDADAMNAGDGGTVSTETVPEQT